MTVSRNSRRIMLSLPLNQYAIIEEAANQAGLPVSSYVHYRLVQAMQLPPKERNMQVRKESL